LRGGPQCRAPKGKGKAPVFGLIVSPSGVQDRGEGVKKKNGGGGCKVGWFVLRRGLVVCKSKRQLSLADKNKKTHKIELRKRMPGGIRGGERKSNKKKKKSGGR